MKRGFHFVVAHKMRCTGKTAGSFHALKFAASPGLVRQPTRCFRLGEMLIVLQIRITHEVKKHPLGTNEASDGARPLRSAAASGSLVLSAPARRLSLLGCLGWAGAAPKPHADRSDGDRAIELLSSPGWCSCGLGKAKGMKNRVCDVLHFF